MGEIVMQFSFSSRRPAAAALAIAGVAATLQVASPTAASAATVTYRTERVNVSSSGAQSASGSAYVGDISGNGRFVVFASDQPDLVPGDTNNADDVFLRDRQAGTTTRISVSPAGEQADSFSTQAAISADGRWIAFVSYATNLLPGVTSSECGQVYLYDRETGALDRISDTAAGVAGDGDSLDPSLSANGRYVSFETRTSNLFPGKGAYSNVARYDRVTGQTTLVNVEDGGDGVATAGSYWASISANGRYVAFASWESDMVPGDTNGELDIFLRDTQAGTTVRVNLSDDDQQATVRGNGPDVSNDGRFVTFWSEDSGLVADDTNGVADIFLRDLQAGTTTAISRSPDGQTANSVSGDPQITPDGSQVVYFSEATNIVPGDTNSAGDVYVKDLTTGENRIVSRRGNGALGNQASFNGRVSRNGQFYVYGSWATNLVKGDTNNETDLFVTRVTQS